MKKIITIAFALVCGLFFTNCELDTGENFFFVNMEITTAEVPDFFVLNETHSLEATFTRPDSCTFFQGFDVFTNENGITTVVAIGSVLTDEDCETTQDSVSSIFTLPIQDVPSYTLWFYSGQDAEGNPQYLEYIVPVVDGVDQ